MLFLMYNKYIINKQKKEADNMSKTTNKQFMENLETSVAEGNNVKVHYENKYKNAVMIINSEAKEVTDNIELGQIRQFEQVIELVIAY